MRIRSLTMLEDWMEFIIGWHVFLLGTMWTHWAHLTACGSWLLENICAFWLKCFALSQMSTEFTPPARLEGEVSARKVCLPSWLEGACGGDSRSPVALFYFTDGVPGSVDWRDLLRNRVPLVRPNDADTAHGEQFLDMCSFAISTSNTAHKSEKCAMIAILIPLRNHYKHAKNVGIANGGSSAMHSQTCWGNNVKDVQSPPQIFNDIGGKQLHATTHIHNTNTKNTNEGNGSQRCPIKKAEQGIMKTHCWQKE